MRRHERIAVSNFEVPADFIGVAVVPRAGACESERVFRRFEWIFLNKFFFVCFHHAPLKERWQLLHDVKHLLWQTKVDDAEQLLRAHAFDGSFGGSCGRRLMS